MNEMRQQSLAAMGKAELQRKVQAHCFMMRDLALYLDTHPTDEKALAEYLKHKEAFAQYSEGYSRRDGALTIMHFYEEDGWVSWSNTPWPWEKEAN